MSRGDVGVKPEWLSFKSEGVGGAEGGRFLLSLLVLALGGYSLLFESVACSIEHVIACTARSPCQLYKIRSHRILIPFFPRG